MKHIILLLTLLSFNSYADSLNFGLITKHNSPTACGVACNDNNQLLAYEHKNIILATFINSFDHRTYLLAKNFRITNNIGLIAGLSHGYDHDCVTFMKKDDGYCDPQAGYKKQYAPFAALLIQKNFGQFKVSWLEAGVYRSLLVGLEF